ncbi:hypothetical protein HL658_22985 [Azospirillum sp. RWY-5-1]|uniref:Uncharacterized protein n=1 Tax=Azospirillum oleiclasticum TaxID=2735135 RepID=A0ABX2TDP6_9PROT|nr:hypothetical protein [Azospirillum oleiclasticum]NYZ15414.1 hypothetical protein [Azospirillum oleiclasticum]NYZ22436.1 hypothetical protein [Azospirillum oleiclasticum]
MTQDSEPPPQLDVRRALDANRRVDEAVSALEGALWRTPPTVQAQVPTQVPTQIPTRTPASAPMRPALALTGTMVPFRPSPRLVPKAAPVEAPAPDPAPPAPATRPEQLADIGRALDEEDADLRRRRTALLEGAVFTLPWDPNPRPVLAAAGDGTLHRVADEELRDVIQPHWRALLERAAAASADLAAAGTAVERMPGWKRLWSGRAMLRAAEQADVAAREAVEAAELIWNSASILDRRNQMRTIADRAVATAAAAVDGVPAIDRALAELADCRARLADLRRRGMSSLERRPGETRTQALLRTAG